MTPASVLTVGLIVGITLAAVGAVWNTAHAYRYRVGRLAAARTFLLGFAVLIATPGAAILAMPDRPLVITGAAVVSIIGALVPVAIARRLRLGN